MMESSMQPRWTDYFRKPFHRWARPWGRMFGWSSVAILIVGSTVATGGIFPTTPAAEQAADQPRPLVVSTTPLVLKTNYQVPYDFVGQVEARRSSQPSFELSGLLVQILVDEGDVVRRGDVIAAIDVEILSSQRKEVAARLSVARARLAELVAGPRKEAIAAAVAQVQRWNSQRELAKITVNRSATLVQQDAVSHQEFDNATYQQQTIDAQWQSATAKLQELQNGTRPEQLEAQSAVISQLQAELQTIDIRINKSTLRAPFHGTIARRFADEGVVIDAGQPILEVLETERLDVRVGVSDRALGSLAVGDTLPLQIRSQTYRATLRALRPDRNQTTRTIDVLLSLPQSTTSIFHGDLAKLTVAQTVEESGFWVPISALTENFRGLWAVFVVSNDGPGDPFVQSRELEILYQTTDRAFVRGSLSPGELIVSSGNQRLVPGQRVQIAPSHSSLDLESERRSTGKPSPTKNALAMIKPTVIDESNRERDGGQAIDSEVY